MLRKAVIIVFFLCISCNSRATDFIAYKKDSIVPAVVFTNAGLEASADYFCSEFGKATGIRIQPAQQPVTNAGVIIQLNLEDKVKGGYFELKQKDNVLSIIAQDVRGMELGIQYFFMHFMSKDKTEIKIPIGLDYSHSYAFEYREPYFPDNFKVQFRKENATQTLEETWGLWGHNIGKVIAHSDKMMAQVNGKVNGEQFCFSSPELFAALKTFIKIQTEDTGHTKFMITPNDNDIVCQCKRCKAMGNTKTNASPAVYTLLNNLAAEFPKLQFFSTAYVTTQTPPPFKTAPNTGVMISTMAFPKGVVLEQSNKKAFVEDTFTGWKKVTDKIYLWDYAVNFDNYFEAYPTVSIAQKNLQYYKKLGVTGVFMHGSEEYYSAFADLKCYLYAQLLQDTQIDVKDYARRFLESKYPSVANLLSRYYATIEDKALGSNKPLDIYGGINQPRKKYLDEKELDDFYAALYEKSLIIDKQEAESLKPLLASMAFMKLELMRTNGIGVNGYVSEPGTPIDPRVNALLENLNAFSASAGIKIYNESLFTIADYIRFWHTEILPKRYKNLLFGKKANFINEPDEEYANVKMLTDGAIGFQDYYNNWLISTANPLKVAVSADDVKGAKTIELSFLNDPRHKIYFPDKVIVMIEGRKFETKVKSAVNDNVPSKCHVTIPVEVLQGDKTIIIEVVKQEDFKKKSTACDEIFFN